MEFLKIGDKVEWSLKVACRRINYGIKKYEGTIIAIVPENKPVENYLPEGMRFFSYHPVSRNKLSYLIRRGECKIVNWPRVKVHKIEEFSGLI